MSLPRASSGQNSECHKEFHCIALTCISYCVFVVLKRKKEKKKVWLAQGKEAEELCSDSTVHRNVSMSTAYHATLLASQ